MCGIFAIINATINPVIIENFVLGKSRGPEFSTIEQFDNNVIGFHRLAINGLDTKSNQPFNIDECILICNGEIYNFREIANTLNIKLQTNSDCEIIIYLYRLFGIEYTLNILDGVFSFVLYDSRNRLFFVCRDPLGVRPLYYGSNYNSSSIYFSSELKSIYNLIKDKTAINNFTPGNYYLYDINNNTYKINRYFNFTHQNKVYNFNNTILSNNIDVLCNDLMYDIVKYINMAVKKRVICDRPIACLLSGGLDSSLITALVNKYYKSNNKTNQQLETYSIGLENSPDLINARKVSNHLKTKHTEIVVSQDNFFNSISEVIQKIESFDTTTVRASVGNYLIAKYIKNNSNAKVIFNGDGADELMGGYIYMTQAPNEYEFDCETRRLLNDIHMFDVLRSDKSISSNGLEPRTPFLDKKWVDFYLSIDRNIRFSTTHDKCEKFLIRKAFSIHEPDLLPSEILWRKKEAFSDGVSQVELSWSDIIKSKIQDLYDTNSDIKTRIDTTIQSYNNYLNPYNKPITLEQAYYRMIYNHYYNMTDNLIPYYWMPKYVDANDASARTLCIYNQDKMEE